MFLILRNNVFMIPSGKHLFFLFLFVLFATLGNSQNILDTENSKKFARYLFNTQQYHLAAVEYERILSISPPDTEISTFLLKSYRLGNICTNSFKHIDALGIERFFINDTIAKEFLNLALSCNCCYENSRFEKALNSLGNSQQTFYRLGYYFFNQEKELLYRFNEDNRNLLAPNYPSVFTRIETMSEFRGKSPALAMTMSAILPGSGKAYSGYWGDAVMSFLFVSSNAWLSYRGFSKKGTKSASGWIFGGVSLGFYMGNIWGSGRSAKSYNEIAYEKMYNEAKNSIYSHF